MLRCRRLDDPSFSRDWRRIDFATQKMLGSVAGRSLEAAAAERRKIKVLVDDMESSRQMAGRSDAAARRRKIEGGRLLRFDQLERCSVNSRNEYGGNQLASAAVMIAADWVRTAGFDQPAASRNLDIATAVSGRWGGIL